LYFDGIYKGNVSGIGMFENTNTILSIGCRYSNENYCSGIIQDVRIYDHILSMAEIQELKKGLIIHYTFDDELATNMLCNEAGYYVENIANNVEYTTTSAAIGTKSIYCKDGL
jgi:hypothetical protein